MQTSEVTPIACTLRPEGLGPRLAEIRKMTERSLLSHRVDGRSLHLAYRPDAENEVRRIVGLEQVCCAFLDFSLASNECEVTLTITAPSDAGDAVHWLFAQFLPAAAAPNAPAANCGCRSRGCAA
jgi:hypothetical protein